MKKTTELATVPEVPNMTAIALERVLIGQDLSKLTPDERISYYRNLCESLGLNPLSCPFAYIVLNGKLTLYAKKDCTEQLRKRDGVSITIVSREMVDDIYVVLARATNKDGRSDESIGAVQIGHLKGEAKANAIMKTETKAKRRVTLSICGLGMLDETEASSIPGAELGGQYDQENIMSHERERLKKQGIDPAMAEPAHPEQAKQPPGAPPAAQEPEPPTNPPEESGAVPAAAPAKPVLKMRRPDNAPPVRHAAEPEPRPPIDAAPTPSADDDTPFEEEAASSPALDHVCTVNHKDYIGKKLGKIGIDGLKFLRNKWYEPNKAKIAQDEKKLAEAEMILAAIKELEPAQAD